MSRLYILFVNYITLYRLKNRKGLGNFVVLKIRVYKNMKTNLKNIIVQIFGTIMKILNIKKKTLIKLSKIYYVKRNFLASRMLRKVGIYINLGICELI